MRLASITKTPRHRLERVDEPGDKLWVPGRCDECAGCVEVAPLGEEAHK